MGWSTSTMYRRCTSDVSAHRGEESPPELTGEERYKINCFAVGGACPWAAGKFIPLRWHRR
eukprot:8347791-Pyramimonas_sp.AAC.1